MKHIHLAFMLFFTVFTSSVFAQIGQERWNRVYTELGANAEFKEVIETSGGVLLAIGYIEEGKIRKGLLVTINVSTGNIIAKKVFSADEGNAKECAFNAVVESGDASFYLVGYRQVRDKVKRAWLLHLDENLEPLNGKNGACYPSEIDKESDHVFEKVTCLNEGTCMIAGKSSSHKSGDVWLFTYKNKKISDIPFTKGNFKDIRALIADENRVWLCGNSNDKKKAALFYSIDKDGATINDAVCDMSKIDHFSTEINDFSLTVQGNLMMAGKWGGMMGKKKVEEHPNGDKNTIVCHLKNSNICQIDISSIRNLDNDQGFLIQPIINNSQRYMLVSDSFYKGNTFHFLYIVDENEKVILKKQLKLALKPKYFFLKIVATLQKPFCYVIALNKEMGDKKIPCLMAYNASEESYASAKGAPSFEIQKPITLQDNSGDNCLSPKERGFIKFTLSTNEGIAQGAEVNVQIETSVSGVNITRLSQLLPEIPQGGKQTVSIPVSASENCQSGTTKLRITVNANGKSKSEVFDLCSRAKEEQLASIFIVPSEELRKSSTKNEKSTKITGKVYASNRLQTKPILNHNGKDIIVEPGKTESKWTDKGLINEKYEYEFAIPVELSEANKGNNTFVIKVGGVESSKIEIQYAKEFNLHLVGIGVPDSNPDGLKYTTKDAADFINTLKLQETNGFFNKVTPYLLNTKEKTTAAEIKKLFGILLKKFRNGEIKKDDYLMILISSHGRIRLNGNFGLLPSDYDPTNEDATDVDYADLVRDFLSQIGCKRFVFIDACHSGSDNGKGIDDEMADKINEAYNASPELVSFNSCSKSERSFEYINGKNGVFTKALLDILNTSPTNQGQFIRIEDAQMRLKSQMSIYLKEIGKQQTPECILNNQTPDLTLFYIPAKK